MSSQLNLILLGPPGAGKGTQATRLRTDLRSPLIATGELLRAHVMNGTPLGQAAEAHMKAGRLVPDELIVDLVTSRLRNPDTRSGFILDGFPRTAVQADALADQLETQGRLITAALFLDVANAEVVRRVAGRRVCAAAGHNYHVEYDPPARADVCDHDGSPLVRREDDEPAAVNQRLVVYREQTAPLIDYYLERRLLHRIDGGGSQSVVRDRLNATIARFRD